MKSPIYVDANVLIYFIEGSQIFEKAARALFSCVAERDLLMRTSEITVAECLYGTHRLRREVLAQQYQQLFFEIGAVDLIAVDLDILEHAALIGADQRLKLVDAIHLASAVVSGCRTFVTNDKRFRPLNGIEIVQLLDVGVAIERGRETD